MGTGSQKNPSLIPEQGASLRRRILTFVVALVGLTLVGSSFSLYRITEVNHFLDEINRVSVPLGRLFTQLQSDAEVYRRELDRSLGHAHWKDPHWKPRPIPSWIYDVLKSEVDRASELIRNDLEAPPEVHNRWLDWSDQLSRQLGILKRDATDLYSALEKGDENAAAQIYPRWTQSMEEWRLQLQSGAVEYERSLRETFSLAEFRVAELRAGLETALVVVVILSLLVFWFGERALRPLGELTRLAREITRRGLKTEDKSVLPSLYFTRKDEVSQLAREFHHMATALLEREKLVESQKDRVQEQNRLLKEMGGLNENVLKSIESLLIVTDLRGRITQCNPEGARWLGVSREGIIGSNIFNWPRLKPFFPGVYESWAEAMPSALQEACRVEPKKVEGRVYGARVMPLRPDSGEASGVIVVLDDLTEELDLQDRLRRAENLAAVGRMSAQVAHEVRNPLHSIGLEAEVAVEMAAKLGNVPLKSALQSILSSVDRLEKITENYLKLSRLSAGEKTAVDLGQVLESVLATYAPACEAQGIKVDWKRIPGSSLKIWGDRDLLEQVLGNLFKNSLQALESRKDSLSPEIRFTMGSAESGRVWVRIEDNGPGIPAEIRSRLFNPFVTSKAQGTGLGLSFVKKVIEEHGGEISFVDRKGVSGACFEMLIPGVISGPSLEKPASKPRVHSGEGIFHA